MGGLGHAPDEDVRAADEGRRVFLPEIAEYFKANQAKRLISQH